MSFLDGCLRQSIYEQIADYDEGLAPPAVTIAIFPRRETRTFTPSAGS
jgi:hypothetical protein